ncbi:hypothetical protein GIB67_029936, partial [Kingdonia uniflora]
GGDPSQKRNDILEITTSSLSTLARLPWGSRSLNEVSTEDPGTRIQLFEFGCPSLYFSTEACPFCRRVREAITELDLSVEVYPCPKGSLKHREMVRRIGGKEQFPFLLDPNTGTSMYESVSEFYVYEVKNFSPIFNVVCDAHQPYFDDGGLPPVYDEYSDDYEYLRSLTDKRRDYDDFLEDEKFQFIDLSAFIDPTWEDFEAHYASQATPSLHQLQVIFRARRLLGFGLRRSCENTVATSIGTSAGYGKFRGRIQGSKFKVYGIVDFDMQNEFDDFEGEIVKYLFQQYGSGRRPSMGLLGSTLVSGWMPTILRAGRGMTLWDKAKLDPPTEKLEVFSYENNPVRLCFCIHYQLLLQHQPNAAFIYHFSQYARIVREALCELELPYILQSVGKGSSRLKLLLQASGSEEVPFLVDPNNGTQLGGYDKILLYLFSAYSAPGQ